MKEEKEVWKPVRNYEGKYMVSNTGKVKSLNYRRTGKEKILKPYVNGGGYLSIFLSKDGKGKHYLVHRLVAESFLPNPNNLPCVNHIDENKLNNIVDNLEFCSYSYNNSYNGKAKKVGKKIRGRKQTEEHIKKRAEKMRGRKLSEEQIKKMSKPVFSVDKDSGLILWWKSASEAERCTGIAQGHITSCCKGKRHTAGNHYWFYDDDDNDTE